jgi:MFS family permease
MAEAGCGPARPLAAGGAGRKTGLRRRERALLGRWVVAFVGGEVVGFGLAAPLGALAGWASDGASGASRAAVAILGGALAGAVEGSVVGWVQWRVLRGPLPAIGRRAWIVATAAGAALAWAIGMSLGTLASPSEEPSFAVIVAGAAVLGAALGALLGAGQWLVLRHQVARAERWVIANSLGWTIGMVVAFGGAGLTEEGTPVVAIVLVAALTGAAMALAPALATGRALLALAAESGGQERAPGGAPAAVVPRPPRPDRRDRLNRLANPTLVRLLRSPLHRLVSGRLLLLTMTSPRSGSTVTFPVGYARRDTELAVVSYRTRSWWRGLADGRPVTVRLRGRELPATGEVVVDEAAVAAQLPGLAGLLGRRRLTAAEAAERARDLVVVRLRVSGRVARRRDEGPRHARTGVR